MNDDFKQDSQGRTPEEVVLDPRLAGGRTRPDKALLAGHWRESAFPLRWNERLLTYILKGSF